jgi:phenylpropionate dioxygenase-like ring-hydroxylating dioxygenase large terminal subunit
MTSLLPQYWYVVAESHELTRDCVLTRQVLDEWLACYRDADGKPVVAQDRCIHRCARLSSGSVQHGKLTCRYHGWVYGSSGKLEAIPSERELTEGQKKIKAKTYDVVEQDGYVYVCLQRGDLTPQRPRQLSELGASLRGRVRLQNRFANTLANCVENYIDVPHTAYVHHGIFRKPRAEVLNTAVVRRPGEVHIEYRGERANLGSFSFFLNPQGKETIHSDHFYGPNLTNVQYRMWCGWQYVITSQSIPVSRMETLVYTDINYDFGIWTDVAKGIVRRQAQRVIDQDIDILNEQGRVIAKYGERFSTTSADAIHTMISEIIEGLAEGVPPTEIKSQEKEIVFLV